MKTPERSKLIEEIYEKFRVPKHVIAHMQGVKRVAEKLADKLIEKGEKIDKKLLLTAALIHDALRVCDFREFDINHFHEEVRDEDLKIWEGLQEKYGKIGHEKAMSQVLTKMGETQLANIIEKHDFWRIDDLETWEEKILYYADKRVDGAKIVTLEKRFEEGTKRNGRPGEDNELRKAVEAKIYKLEKEINISIPKDRTRK